MRLKSKRKHFQITYPKGLESRIYKEFSKPNNKKINKSIKGKRKEQVFCRKNKKR